MSTASVAIVIPTFNRVAYLENAIRKSLEQTHPCQVIVCDHGSSDTTPQAMRAYADRVTYIRRERDLGPHFCWLEGVLNADAEYIHLQFDDDWTEKDFIAQTLTLMEPDVGFVFTEAYEFNEDTQERRRCYRLAESFTTGIHDAGIVERLLLQGRNISPASCLFRKKDVIDALYQGALPILTEHGYHGVGPDHFMSLLCVLRYRKVGVITEPLAVFRAHPGSITVNAQGDDERLVKLNRAYEATRSYYRLLRLFHRSSWVRWRVAGKPLLKTMERWLKLFLLFVKLRKKAVKPL